MNSFSLTCISGRSDAEVFISCVVCSTCTLLLFRGRSVGTEIVFKAEVLTDSARHRQGCGRLEASLGLLGGALLIESFRFLLSKTFRLKASLSA